MFGKHHERDQARWLISPGNPAMRKAGVEVNGIARLDHVGFAAQLDLDASFLDEKHHLALEMPGVGSRPTCPSARLKMDSPNVEPVTRNHPDEMFKLGVFARREALSVFTPQNCDLFPDIDFFEQLARTAIQSVGNFDQDRNRRSRL